MSLDDIKIKVAGLAEESVVDGTGIRFTIFVQGCPHRCFNCHNPQTHDTDGGEVVDLGELFAKIKANPLLDGVTLSGGEPFLYAKELSVLCEEVKNLELNVWCYTGFTFEELKEAAKTDKDILKLLGLVDVLVDGNFVDSLKDLTLKFRGSSNQRLIDLKAMRSKGNSQIIELDL